MSHSYLAVSGSLRAESVNAEVLRAIDNLSGDHVAFTLYTGLGKLPQFNPDLEDDAPASVGEWRDLLRRSQGVVICSPEYAHGVPGALKNALDWVVGTGEFMNKPVLLLNASPASTFVGPQLTETLSVMMAKVHSVTLSMAGKKRDGLSMRMDKTISGEMQAALQALAALVDSAA